MFKDYKQFNKNRIELQIPDISLNIDKNQIIRFYEMFITLLTSKSNRRAAPGCYTFDSVESHIYFFLTISRRILKYLLNLYIIIAEVKITEID